MAAAKLHYYEVYLNLGGHMKEKKLSTYILEHKLSYLLGILCILISVSLDLTAPQLTKKIIDEVIVGGQIEKLKYFLAGILCIGVGRCVFQYIKEYTFDLSGIRITAKMRRHLFDHIQSLSADFFDRTGTGELMARIKDDIDRIGDGLTFVGMLIIEVVIHTSIVLFFMFRLDAGLAVIPAAAMLIAGTVAIVMERKLDSVYEAISEETAALNTVAEENLAGVRTVKAFAREKYEIGKFLSHNKKYYDLNMRQSKIFVTYYPYLSFITKLLPLVILLFGGRLAVKGELTLGALGAFVEYSMNIVWPMEMLGWLTNSFSSAVASNRKLKRIYAQQPTITEKDNPIVPDKILGKIEFSHVSFSKKDADSDSDHEILRDISFTVNPGKTIGIMGATGSGKSSIVYLLQRFYDATKGSVLIDGINVKDMRFEQLRGNISLVMQDVFLFSDTISENVKLGKRSDLDSYAVKRASEAAQASQFIERMDSQYDTVIGERGVGLSGGQKQRISIARAIAKKHPILVLDDSTSALDMETERMIQHTLLQLKDTTKIIIAHRISSVMHADEIIYLENGSIRERGTHEALMAAGGLYAETYAAQYSGLYNNTAAGSGSWKAGYKGGEEYAH